MKPKMEPAKIQALKNAAIAKRENTKCRVTQALNQMKASEIAITFQSVAKYAGVSKTWLYGENEFREQILRERDQSNLIYRMLDQKKQIEKKDSTIDLLTKRIKQLSVENEQLRTQVEIAYGALYKEEK